MARKGERAGRVRECRVCGDEFYASPSTIKRGHGKYCSRKCKVEAGRVDKGRCSVCGKELKRTKGRFCSYKCFGLSIRKRVVVKCVHCGKEFDRKRSASKKSRFCSKGCWDAFQRQGKMEYRCKVCGKRFTIKGRGRKMVFYCSMDCRDSDPDFLEGLAKQNRDQQHRNGLNKLELAGRGILRGMGLEFEEQVLLFGKFTVDSYLRGHGLVVQWDGDYWHGNPRRFRVLNARQMSKRKNDRSCDAYLRKCGLRVLRFWESDVKWRPEMVTTEITKALAGVNIG